MKRSLIWGFILMVLVFMLPDTSFCEEGVDISTVTGHSITIDDSSGVAVVEGDAVVQTATATMKADRIELDNNSKTGRAFGHVSIVNATSTITGSEGEYNWETSTGTMLNAEGHSPPWRFTAQKMEQEGPGLYRMFGSDFTSCSLNPPHYSIRSKRSRVKVGNRATMKQARFMIDKTPSFYLPFYTKSLKPKKYSIRFEPGSSGRDGLTNRTIIGYPFSTNSYTKVRWDWLERTGNGAGLQHRYFNPNISGDLDAYYIRDINPDPLPQSRRYNVLWNHYQRLTERLTANAKLDFKSDQVFGNQFSNVGNDVRIENQTRGIFSEGALNYQFPRATLQMLADRRDKFDSTVSSSNFISKLTLPRLTFNTIPIKTRFTPFYTSLSATYVNETLTRIDPDETLRYQRSANSTILIRRDIKISKSLTYTPFSSYTQSWMDRDLLLKDSTKDVHVGRYSVGSDLRKRFGRTVDLNVNYNYSERFERNRTTLDISADDYGVESNLFTGSLTSRIGRTSRLSLTSGYNINKAPRSDVNRLRHDTSRITPPTLDLEWRLNRNTVVYFRETYSLYSFADRKVVRTPLNTSGEIQFGDIFGKQFFSQGFSYTKNFGETDPADLLLTNKLRFYASPKWHIDFLVSYRATGEEKLDYRKVIPIEKTLRVARDMHCWILRMEFSDRPGRREASFYIDLKANIVSQPNVFRSEPPSLESGLDVGEIFPVETFEQDETPLNLSESASDSAENP